MHTRDNKSGQEKGALNIRQSDEKLESLKELKREIPIIERDRVCQKQ